MNQVATIELFVLLLVASTLVVLAARWVRLPYTLALLLLGLALGMIGVRPELQLTSRVILLLFLPPLLFEAAYALDLDVLWAQRRGVLALALPGVLLAAAVGGPLVRWGTGLPWDVALLFGVMIAATDPVSVLATFRQLGVAPRLAVLVEGESLFNDGVSLALFGALVAAVGGAGQGVGGLSPGGVALDFLRGVAGGALVGLAIGYLGVRLIALVDEDLTEMAVSAALAYGSFLAAEVLHLSGVIAVLTAAMVLNRVGRAQGLSAASARRLDDLWEFLAFVANAALFLLMGLIVSATGLLEHPGDVLWGIVAALAGRAAVAYGLGTLLGTLGLRLTWPERHVVFWGGLRGAVALAAALSLPPDFPARTQLLAMTYGVVLFTLLAQGLTVDPLVRRLGLVEGRGENGEGRGARGEGRQP